MTKKTFPCNTIVCDDVIDGLKKLPDNVASVVFTSPPYNVKITYGDDEDDMPYLDYLQWLKKVWTECYRVLRKGGRLVINIDATTNLQDDGRDRMNCIYADNHQLCKEIGFKFYQEHVWVKQNRCGKKTAWGSYMSPSLPSCLRSHEYILVYSKEQYKLEGTKLNTDITKEEFGEYIGSEWHVAPETRNLGGHPVPFPEPLAYRVIKLYSYRDDLIVDPFSGTGTTCVVARKAGRRYFGIDNDKQFVDYSLGRIEEVAMDESFANIEGFILEKKKTRRELEKERLSEFNAFDAYAKEENTTDVQATSQSEQ